MAAYILQIVHHIISYGFHLILLVRRQVDQKYDRGKSASDRSGLPHRATHSIYAVFNPRPRCARQQTQARCCFLHPSPTVKPHPKHLIFIQILVHKYAHILHLVADHTDMLEFGTYQAHQRVGALIHISRCPNQPFQCDIRNTLTHNPYGCQDSHKHEYDVPVQHCL